MAAAQPTGTPAAVEAAPTAATAEPAGETITAESHGLAALLGDLSAEDAEPAQETPAGDDAETDEEAEPTETEPTEPVDAAKKLDDEVIFSDEALSTKEGNLRAKQRNQQLRRMNYEKYLELKKYEGRVVKRDERSKHRIANFVAEKRNYDLVINNMRATVANARSGRPDLMVQALGQMYEMDGLKALELLNSELIHKGKVPMDPQVQAVIDGLRQEVEQLKGGLNERQTQERIQQLQHREQQHHHAIGQRITTQAEQMPHLSRIYADDPEGTIEHIVETVTEAHEEFKAGRRAAPLDMQTYLVNLEGQLTKAINQGQAPQGDGGGPAPKQPAPVAQRSPGQSVGPRTAAVSTPRVPTDDENLRALSQDDALMSSLGLG